MKKNRCMDYTDIDHSNDIHITEIQKEYKRIDSNWLMLHYKTTIGVVLFALFVECILSVIFVNSELLHTTVGRYILKFIVLPSSLNFLCVAADTVVMKSEKLSQSQKIYTVSIVFVVICFILFSAHSAFSASYYIFTGAIMLTTIYANYRVTSITAFTCILAIILSELFVRWDADKISIFDSVLRLGDFLVSIIILIAFSMASMVVIRFEQKKNEASIQMEIERCELRRSLQVDEMTGIFNRKAMHDAMKDMEDNAQNDSYILAVVDVDNFKGINDSWGHHFGDRCLKEFAGILKENSYNYTPFRYGGDEFCLLFSNVTMEAAVETCEQIRLKLQELRIDDQPMIRLTASFGLAAYTSQADSVRLFIHSDYALYEAKEVRNAVRVYKNDAKDHG